MPARRTGAPVLRHKARMQPRTVPSWMERAACASHDDPDLWFAERGEEERQREALGICAACPVRPACLAYVLSMPPQAMASGAGPPKLDSAARERKASAAS